ncbi:MAG: phosphatase [Candidatus Epulonipiscioides saccharophilum]|nr:MAG: phosphatase [Epulopiscium sp. AS2M-Bin001]
MEFLVDLHTHTISSGHAYSTFDENVRFAKEHGIKLLGISDHAPSMPGGAHLYHFTNLRAVPKEVYGVRILRGVELNIIDYSGTIDLSETTIRNLDYTIASLHPPCIDFADIKSVTYALLETMQNPLVNIIGHPGDQRYPQNLYEITKMAKKTNTLLEVNNASLSPDCLRVGVRESLIEMLSHCNKLDLPIIANSDAHICYEVGDFTNTFTLLDAVEFPKDLILNLYPERVLDFLGIQD